MVADMVADMAIIITTIIADNIGQHCEQMFRDAAHDQDVLHFYAYASLLNLALGQQAATLD